VSNNDHRRVAIANFQSPVNWSRAVPERGIRASLRREIQQRKTIGSRQLAIEELRK